jgi:hypothetical protein
MPDILTAIIEQTFASLVPWGRMLFQVPDLHIPADAVLADEEAGAQRAAEDKEMGLWDSGQTFPGLSESCSRLAKESKTHPIWRYAAWALDAFADASFLP